MQCAQLKKLDLSWNCLDTPLGSTNEAYEKSPCNLHKSPQRYHKVHVRCVLVGIYLPIFLGALWIFFLVCIGQKIIEDQDHPLGQRSIGLVIVVFDVSCVPCVLF